MITFVIKETPIRSYIVDTRQTLKEAHRRCMQLTKGKQNILIDYYAWTLEAIRHAFQEGDYLRFQLPDFDTSDWPSDDAHAAHMEWLEDRNLLH